MVRMVIAGASVMALAACFGPGDPVELPKDPIEAARTCFAAQGMVLREGKSASDPITYDEFVTAIRYPMVAAAQADPFSIDTIGTVIEGADKLADDLRSKDYAGAVTTCDARFGTDDKVELPESETDAVLACLSLASFMQGAVQAQGGEFGDKGAAIGPLVAGLQKRMESDPEMLVKLAGAKDVQAMMADAMKPAFAEGAPAEYIAACTARFPGGN